MLDTVSTVIITMLKVQYRDTLSYAKVKKSLQSPLDDLASL